MLRLSEQQVCFDSQLSSSSTVAWRDQHAHTPNKSSTYHSPIYIILENAKFITKVSRVFRVGMSVLERILCASNRMAISSTVQQNLLLNCLDTKLLETFGYTLFNKILLIVCRCEHDHRVAATIVFLLAFLIIL